MLDYATMPAPGADERNSGFVVFEPNRGLPDYIHKSPFTANPAIFETLRRRLAQATASPVPCKVGEVEVPGLSKAPLFSNVCDTQQSDGLRNLVAELAPDLTAPTTAVWKLSVTPSGEPELLVTHIDLSGDPNFRYPYLSLWRLQPHDGKLNAQFGGSFLSGRIHTIRRFGRENNSNKVFVKHLSCIECEPLVYLSVIDFSHESPMLFKFTYAADHRDYGETIEYELPGMGHSVEANVETRIPKGGPSAVADLIQEFRFTEEKKVQWWVFFCEREQCDYRLFEGALPEKYRTIWASADKL